MYIEAVPNRNSPPAILLRESGVVQKVLAPGYTERRQRRAGKGIRRLECYPDLNHTTSAERRAMTQAERKAKQRQREQTERERLTYRSDEWRQFCDRDTLPRKAGASWEDMPALVLRELADNACDAAQGKGAWIESVIIYDAAWWCIGDHGGGIAPDEVERKFSVNRPMESTKHIRLPTRGMLGNGCRVVAGYAAIERLPIMVESRSMRTVLRVDNTTGRTRSVRQTPIEPLVGTRIYLPLVRELAIDGVEELAEKTLALADPRPDASNYSGPSSPWWYSARDLLTLLATAQAGVTVGDVVHDMGLKMPQGVPNGPAAEATAEQAAALLTALRDKNNCVAEKKIGCVGKDAFSDCYPGYALVSTTRKKPGDVEVPAVVEVWARCDGWKRRGRMHRWKPIKPIHSSIARPCYPVSTYHPVRGACIYTVIASNITVLRQGRAGTG